MKAINSDNWETRTERWVQMLDDSTDKKKRKWKLRVDQKIVAAKKREEERKKLKSFWR